MAMSLLGLPGSSGTLSSKYGDYRATQSRYDDGVLRELLSIS